MIGLSCVLGGLGAIAGAFLLGRLGLHHWGLSGAVGGGALGAFGGAIVTNVLLSVLDRLGRADELRFQRRKLCTRFGEFWTPQYGGAWERAKQMFCIVQSVSGVLVTEEYWGAFVDIGAGFPAHLSHIDWDASMHSKVPGPGNTVVARVYKVDDATRYIHLTRRADPHGYP